MSLLLAGGAMDRAYLALSCCTPTADPPPRLALQTWVSNAVLTPGSLVTFILTAADGQSVEAVVADPWTANRSLGVNFS